MERPTPETLADGRGAIPDAEQLAHWPRRDRREPRRHERHYLGLKYLAALLRQEIDSRFSGRTGISVLDAGCGTKPYLPFVAPYAAMYRGLDMAPGEYVDDVGAVETLPYPDESFDLVLCTQVFEHLADPDAATREIHRVLRPDGVALVSTHGVFLYHPDPVDTDKDYWRWTHSGLRKLFSDNAPWRALEIHPNGEFVACIGYLVAQFVDEAASRVLPGALRRGIVSTLNHTAEALDRRYPPRARVPRPGSLSANYLVVATK
jgi:SAM-dependent methyltransferase